MKRTIIRLILAALLLVACGSTPVLADGPKGATPLFNGPGLPPLCDPGNPNGCPNG